MVEARHLRKTFSNTVAVNDVSFRAVPGEVIGLLGPNGAGKTTLIRMLLGIYKPDSGQVLYKGRPFSRFMKGESGYLPEERGLYRKSRLLDTIIYLAMLRGMKKMTARREAGRWLQRFHLEEYATRKVEELSKGNQQKVQFVVAILHDPWLVVLDEPFSGLDPMNQEILRDVLNDLRSRGKTIIFSTHQMEQAERMCDKLLLINKGDLILEGDVADIKRKHGRNSVRIEFAGEGRFISALTGVRNVSLYSRYAEIEIEDGYSAIGILSQVAEKVEIRRFETFEPSLLSIFIDAVAKGEKGRTGQ